jgi:hypothetical protein
MNKDSPYFNLDYYERQDLEQLIKLLWVKK